MDWSNESLKDRLLQNVNDLEMIVRGVGEYATLPRNQRSSAKDLSALIQLLSIKEKEFKSNLNLVGEHVKRENLIGRMEEELDLRSEDLQKLQECLKEAETQLITSVFQANQKLKSISQAKSRKVDPDALISYAHRISKTNAVASPVTWQQGDLTRPFPTDMEMRRGWLYKPPERPDGGTSSSSSSSSTMFSRPLAPASFPQPVQPMLRHPQPPHFPTASPRLGVRGGSPYTFGARGGGAAGVSSPRPPYSTGSPRSWTPPTRPPVVGGPTFQPPSNPHSPRPTGIGVGPRPNILPQMMPPRTAGGGFTGGGGFPGSSSSSSGGVVGSYLGGPTGGGPRGIKRPPTSSLAAAGTGGGPAASSAGGPAASSGNNHPSSNNNSSTGNSNNPQPRTAQQQSNGSNLNNNNNNNNSNNSSGNRGQTATETVSSPDSSSSSSSDNNSPN